MLKCVCLFPLLSMLLQQLFFILLLIEQIKYLTLCIAEQKVQRKSASSGKSSVPKNTSKLNFGSVKN